VATQERTIRELLEKLEDERLKRLARAWEAYGGDHPDSLEIGDDDVDDNVVENLCRLTVRKGVSYLLGNRLEFEISGSERDKETGKAKNDAAKAEDYLEEVLERNRRPRLLRNYATNGGVTGHAFAKIVPPDDSTPDDYPKIRAIDPGYVTPEWEADDYEDVYLYRITYPGVDRDGRIVLIRQEIEKVDDADTDDGVGWTIRDQRASADRIRDDLGQYGAVRTRAEFETEKTTAWAYEFAPIVENQNLPRANEYWGESDIEADVIDLNYALNAALSNMNRTVRIFAHPRVVFSGLTATELAQVDVSPNGAINLPNPEAKGEVLEPKADLSAMLEFYKLLRQGFHEVARVPEITTRGSEGLGPLAGVAMRILYGPLMELTDEKRETYGEAISALIRRLLVLGDWDIEKLVVVLKWPEVMPNDPVAERQVAVYDRDLGVSTRTTLERIGYDPDVEAAHRRTEAEEAEAAFDRGEGGGDAGGGDAGGGPGGAGTGESGGGPGPGTGATSGA
jgi:hypothetical protein